MGHDLGYTKRNNSFTCVSRRRSGPGVTQETGKTSKSTTSQDGRIELEGDWVRRGERRTDYTTSGGEVEGNGEDLPSLGRVV